MNDKSGNRLIKNTLVNNAQKKKKPGADDRLVCCDELKRINQKRDRLPCNGRGGLNKPISAPMILLNTRCSIKPPFYAARLLLVVL